MNLKSPFTIVCLGDSITCEWDEPKYPTFWQELLDQKYGPGKIKVISAGINGETAQDGYYRLDRDVLIHKPDLVTIMFGHNDLYWQIEPESYNTYLRKIYNYLNHAGVQNIWLVSPNQVGDQEFAREYQPYLQAGKDAAHEKGIPYINVWKVFDQTDFSKIFTYFIKNTTPPLPDYTHPNQLGHQLIAQYLFDQFIQKDYK